MLLPWYPMHWPTKISSTRRSSTEKYPKVFTTPFRIQIQRWTNDAVNLTVRFIFVLSTLVFLRLGPLASWVESRLHTRGHSICSSSSGQSQGEHLLLRTLSCYSCCTTNTKQNRLSMLTMSMLWIHNVITYICIYGSMTNKPSKSIHFKKSVKMDRIHLFEVGRVYLNKS